MTCLANIGDGSAIRKRSRGDAVSRVLIDRRHAPVGARLAEPFSDVPVAGRDLKRLFADRELDEQAVVKQYLITATEGKWVPGHGSSKLRFASDGSRGDAVSRGLIDRRHAPVGARLTEPFDDVSVVGRDESRSCEQRHPEVA